MSETRRSFLTKAGAGLGSLPLAGLPLVLTTSVAAKESVSTETILPLFKSLPGDVAFKIYSPAAGGKPEFLAESNPAKQLFVGSAIKTFILCESLRQADSPNVVQILKAQQLTLDASVWSVDSATFNPPNLIGKVSQRTALEAMIMHSDNTGTDMSIKHAGPDKVREFIASIGLKNTQIPDSTRSLFAYLLNAKNYKTFSWDELSIGVATGKLVNPALNKVESMVSTPDDFVSYYSRALQGEFFKNKQTLAEFRRILTLGDAISLLPVPLGVTSFCKGGSIDLPGFHAICAPGGMCFDDRWVYFFLAYNWHAEAETDPAGAADFVTAASRALQVVKDALAA